MDNTVTAVAVLPSLAAINRFGVVYDHYGPDRVVKLASKAGLTEAECLGDWEWISSDNKVALYNAAIELEIYKPKA